MQWIYLICFALINAGLLALFGSAPEILWTQYFCPGAKPLP